jgi:integrase
MSTKKRLTDRLLKSNSIIPDEDTKRTTIWDEKVTGFGIRVSHTGTISFFVRYRVFGKNRRYTIGKYPQISLSDARREALDIKRKAMDDIDPARNNQDNCYSDLESLIEVFWEEYATKKLAESTRNQYRVIIDRYLLPAFGSMNPGAITKNHVKNLMQDVVERVRDTNKSNVEDDKKGNRMANMVKNVLSSIFSHTDIELPNPCRQVQNFERAGPRKNPLNEKQIKTLWEVLETEHIVTASFFRILLITGQRRGETSRMQWKHIEDEIWTIPGEDAKNGEMHKVPLTSLAQELLDELEPETGDSPWVFQSPSSLNDSHINSFSRSPNRIREKADFTKDDFRIHDLRSTVRTYLAELGVRKEIADRIQNHSIKGVADKHYDAYRYVPEKREALEKWDTKLREIIEINKGKDEETNSMSDQDDQPPIDDSPLLQVLSQLSGDLENVVPDPEKRGMVKAYLENIEAQRSSSNPDENLVAECRRKIEELIT